MNIYSSFAEPGQGRLAVAPAARLFRADVADEIGRQLGVFPKRSAGADGAFQNDGRCRHGRLDDLGIVALLCRALVEEIAVGAPGF